MLPDSGETSATSDDCAQRCKALSDCKASDWYYSTQVCNMYSRSDNGDTVLGSVFMIRVTPAPGLTDPADKDELATCKKNLSKCNAEKDDLGDELEECKSGRADDKKACDDKITELEEKLQTCLDNRAADEQACEDKIKALEQKLDTCEKGKCALDPAWERRKEAMKICGYGGRKKIVAGSSTYTAHCQRRVGPSKFYRQEALGVDECLAECSKDPQCKAIHYVIMNDAHCKFLEAGKTVAVPVEEEDDCARSPLIGFAPTIPK